MYSFPDLESVCCSMSSCSCCLLTYIHIFQEVGKAVSYSHLLKHFPQFVVIHTVKGFGAVNKAEVDVFLELSHLLHDPTDVGNLISGSSAFSKSSLNIWKFTVHVLLKPGLENFEHYFTSMWDECNCVVVWAFFGIAFLLSISTLPVSVLGLQVKKMWLQPLGSKRLTWKQTLLIQCDYKPAIINPYTKMLKSLEKVYCVWKRGTSENFKRKRFRKVTFS